MRPFVRARVRGPDSSQSACSNSRPSSSSGSPSAARRLLSARPETLAREPLLGDSSLWKDWFTAAGRAHERADGCRFQRCGPHVAGSRTESRPCVVSRAAGRRRTVRRALWCVCRRSRSCTPKRARTTRRIRQTFAIGRRWLRFAAGSTTSSTPRWPPVRATVVDNVPETRAPVPALARKAAKSRAVNAQEKGKARRPALMVPNVPFLHGRGATIGLGFNSSIIALATRREKFSSRQRQRRGKRYHQKG